MAKLISDVAAEYLEKVAEQTPTPKNIAKLVKHWTADPDALIKASAQLKALKNTANLPGQKPSMAQAPSVANTMKPGQTMPVGANTKKPAVAKGPTWIAQLKGIAAGFGLQKDSSVNINDLFGDPEFGNIYGAIKKALNQKFNPTGNSYTGKTKAEKAGTDAVNIASKVSNPSTFMTAVLKLVDPNAKPFDLNTPVNPGEFQGMPVPTDQLTSFAKTHIPDPVSQQKAIALAQKIADYEALIAKLKAEQNKAFTAKTKAEDEKDELSGIDEKVIKYFSWIEKNCSEYLSAVKAAGGKLLFRGNNDAEQTIYLGNPRADREPKDSSKEAQRLLDGYLSAVGFKALRGNSIFTSADYNQAEGYGTVYAIFPKNGFSFTWSTQHNDLVMHSPEEFGLGGSDEAQDAADEYEEWYDTFISMDDDLYNHIANQAKAYKLPLTKQGDYAIDPFRKKIQALPAWKALTKSASKYYELSAYDGDPAIKFHQYFVAMVEAYIEVENTSPLRWFTKNEGKQIGKLVTKAKEKIAEAGKNTGIDKKKAQQIITKQGFTNQNLPAALKAEHEVCILGEYVAVSWESFEDEIEKYFIKPNKVAKVKKSK